MDKKILQAENIKKSFFNGEIETSVLNGVDINVKQGEFVAIVGESGSGKSTLLYILAGIDKPTSGKIELLGQDISLLKDNKISQMRRQDFSFVYQFGNLVPNLTAFENIALPLMLDKQKEKNYKDKVLDIANFLGIEQRLKNLPRQLSGGEQQRVAIARAMVTSPKIIFLDEPTGSLDKIRGNQVMELLKKINNEKEVALVMVTHSQAHANYANRIVEMEDGILKLN